MRILTPSPTPDPPPALVVRDIVKTYRLRSGLFQPKRQLVAVDGVSLTVGRGETVGIVGESGCGKSTLAKIMLGLLAPDSGEVLMDGRSVASMHRLEVSRFVQPIFQDPYSSLNPRKSVGEIIGLPLVLHSGKSRADIQAEVLIMLDQVGLARRYVDHYPSQLSGGQRQRVAIARALVLRPRLVICDEPTSALDVSVQAQIINLLVELQDQLGLTYVFISHNLAVVEHLCTRVAVMNAGKVVEEAPTDQLFGSPAHAYTRALLQSAIAPMFTGPEDGAHAGRVAKPTSLPHV